MEPIYSGKVREIYDISDKYLVIVTTDRISAFDNILPMPIKGKGIVLNKLSNFWFNKTQSIVMNHIIDDRVENMPLFFQNEYFRERTVMVEKLRMLPFEFVVRGYMFGSMWKAYDNGESFCGIRLPNHYGLAQKLEQPILTPAIKHDIGHDEYVSMDEVESELGTEMTKQITETCFRLYKMCSEYAISKGLIIADAKFEFGQNRQGELVLADEIFTPDSSRYWDAGSYKVGVSPNSFDKQFLRDWLLNNKLNGVFQYDKVPENVLIQTEKLYNECLDRLISITEC
ncbi:MAG: phosphoribosylaminoimidazolesuccinocarboxamide synthase [Lachnospiraceae bacterium]|nr:phosphoribosylaminoimidazolesuccinocarboxamide synthase [Lachnospiraceae bacterium]